MIEIFGRSFVTILYNVFVLRRQRSKANRLGKELRTSDCTDIPLLVDSGSGISCNIKSIVILKKIRYARTNICKINRLFVLSPSFDNTSLNQG